MATHCTFKRQGFSLVEISIVLMILAIVLSGMLPFITESMRAREQETTLERMKVIEEAIVAYAVATNSLPCPSDNSAALDNANYGVQVSDIPANSVVAGRCQNAGNTLPGVVQNGGLTVATGGVPTRTLGLPDEYGFDGWQNRFSYTVSYNNLTTLANTGQLFIFNYYGVGFATPAAYGLVSHGVRAHGAYNRAGNLIDPPGNSHAAEQHNSRRSNTMTALSSNRLYVNGRIDDSNLANVYDDLTVYKTPNQLLVNVSVVNSSTYAGPIFCTNANSNGGADDNAACRDAAVGGGIGTTYEAFYCRDGTDAEGQPIFTSGTWSNCDDGTILVRPR